MAVSPTPISSSGDITLGDLLQYAKDNKFDDTTTAGTRKMKQIVNEALQEARNSRKWPFQVEKSGRIVFIADYTTGTASVNNGSTAVTGVGTSWSDSYEGGYIRFGTDKIDYKIQTVTDTTHIVLATAYQGSNQSGATYAIIVDAYNLPSDFGSLCGAPQTMNNSGAICELRERDTYLYERTLGTRTGTPTEYYVDEQANQLIVTPAPDEADVCIFQYHEAFPEYTNTSEVVAWPYKYINVLHRFIDIGISRYLKEPQGEMQQAAMLAADKACGTSSGKNERLVPIGYETIEPTDGKIIFPVRPNKVAVDG